MSQSEIDTGNENCSSRRICIVSNLCNYVEIKLSRIDSLESADLVSGQCQDSVRSEKVQLTTSPPIHPDSGSGTVAKGGPPYPSSPSPSPSGSIACFPFFFELL